MPKNKQFTPEFKARIALLLVSEKMSVSEVCSKYKLKSQTVSRWKSELIKKSPQAFGSKSSGSEGESEKVAELERLIGQLTMEIAILKKATNLWS